MFTKKCDSARQRREKSSDELDQIDQAASTGFFKQPAGVSILKIRNAVNAQSFIAFWAAPTMTTRHQLFAAVITVYILINILLEERDLVDLFGDDCRRYQGRVSKLVPWRKSA
jgi:methanethiol S-methyltransferase